MYSQVSVSTCAPARSLDSRRVTSSKISIVGRGSRGSRVLTGDPNGSAGHFLERLLFENAHGDRPGAELLLLDVVHGDIPCVEDALVTWS
jgi:hypothetical protein